MNGSDVGKVHDTDRKGLLRVILVAGIGCATPLLSVLQPACSMGFLFITILLTPVTVP